MKGGPLPTDLKYALFPPERDEYELVYAAKDREEDILGDTMRVPLQPVREFGKTNGTRGATSSSSATTSRRPGVDFLLITAGDPDQRGNVFPVEEAVFQFLITHPIGLAGPPDQIQRVVLSLMGHRVRPRDPPDNDSRLWPSLPIPSAATPPSPGPADVSLPDRKSDQVIPPTQGAHAGWRPGYAASGSR